MNCRLYCNLLRRGSLKVDVSICIHMLTHILSGKCSAGSKHYKKVERAVHKECFEGKCLQIDKLLWRLV